MKDLFLSIIMPAKNRGKLIGESIETYLNQRYKNWELIIIDDHSQDNTLGIARKYQKINQKIKIFELKNQTGAAPARDLGIKKAKGEIIVIGDSDDLADPLRLKRINHSFQQTNCSCFYSNCKLLYEQEKKIVLRPFLPFNAELLKMINYIANSSSAFRKKIYFEAGGYDPQFQMSEDYDLWLRFTEKKYRFCWSSESLITIRIHEQSIRSEKREEAKFYINLVREKHHLPSPNQDDVKNLVTPKYWEYLATPGGLDLWFD